MSTKVREDAKKIIDAALAACQPSEAVERALADRQFGRGKVVLAATGKAAWSMARTASECLGDRLDAGVVVTKYGHDMGPIAHCTVFEAGHPVPDENSFRGTAAAMDLVRNLGPGDEVIFLVSGGGSALFEYPLIPPAELADLTKQLLRCGADIVEMNTIRKRLSGVKGGRFTELCAPAHVFSIVLSDIIGDPLDMIASGPGVPDQSTCRQALHIADKYKLTVSSETMRLLQIETPKELDNVETVVTGSVRELCRAAAKKCEELGYGAVLLTDQLCCQAREAGSFLASVARTHQNSERPAAFLAGGETVVKVTGSGKGGRNQELALAAAEGISGLKNTVVFSVGSDGTDGPTDAAGGLVDGMTRYYLEAQGISIPEMLAQNDAYHALAKANGLIFTGPTGTNVNDFACVLIGEES